MIGLKSTLRTVAGYALTRPESEFARLRDACAAAEPLVADDKCEIPVAPALPVLRASPKGADIPVSSGYTAGVKPDWAIAAEGHVSCQSGGQHRFDIRTRLCEGCGRTFRQIRGHEPEFM
jgi:hypothetical protein